MRFLGTKRPYPLPPLSLPWGLWWASNGFRSVPWLGSTCFRSGKNYIKRQKKDPDSYPLGCQLGLGFQFFRICLRNCSPHPFSVHRVTPTYIHRRHLSFVFSTFKETTFFLIQIWILGSSFPLTTLGTLFPVRRRNRLAGLRSAIHPATL